MKPAMKEESQAEKFSLNAEKPSENFYRTTSSLQVLSSPSISLVSPEKFDRSIDPVILRTLSSSPLQGMSRNPSDPSVGRLLVKGSLETSFRASESNQIPRRNLTEAFEELYIEPSADTETPTIKQTQCKDGSIMTNMISPTGVIELNLELPEGSSIVTPSKDDLNTLIPSFELHPVLKRELSDALMNRVSFYAVIHDINKEASAMALNDDSGYNRNPEDLREEYDPLIVAVNGYPGKPLPPSSSLSKVALIDEERWLLDAIDARRNDDESRSIKACPPTFLQAMGERDYENPLTSLSNGSRTQLWKPSRSWWEAKSGKNPWIEPKSHNKRWRYLWPLIHYHKFLARCIKKLKRNQVDVKTSVSPVSVFLREEVCDVSDHLAGVSLFDSDEWMDCLQYFNGWTNPDEEAEEHIRGLVSKLKLRPLGEPGDVDSALLRSQIDEQYLQAMASARAQMAGVGLEQEGRHNKGHSSRRRDDTPDAKAKPSILPSQSMAGPPPAYPRASPASYRPQPHMHGASPAALGRPRWGYPPQHGQWWGNGYHPHPPYPYRDDASVHSALSGDTSFQQQYDPNMSGYPGAMHLPHYYHPMMYPQHQMLPGQPQGAYDPSMQDPSTYGLEGCNPEQFAAMDWGGQPHVGHMPPPSSTPSLPGTPGAPLPVQDMPAYTDSHANTHHIPADQTPYKYNPNQVPMSPYWGHLDHATLAMMGIATPQGHSAPQTPARAANPSSTEDRGDVESKPESHGAAGNAQPLLLRQQYYGYGYGNREGYGPPSPATQFMMSPQANFAYNYGYGVSPSRNGSAKKYTKSMANVAKNTVTGGGGALPASVTPPSNKRRESPATVDTTDESNSP